MQPNEKYSFSQQRPWEKFYKREHLDLPIPECSVYRFLRDFNGKWPEVDALSYFDRKITFGELFDDIDKAASVFAKNGVRDGDIVSLCALTTPETVTVFYALNKLGAVSNFIEPRTNSGRICAHINNVHSRVLIVMDAFVGKINEILSQLPEVEQIIILPLSRSMPLATRIGFGLTKGRQLPRPAKDPRYIGWEKYLKSYDGSAAPEPPYEKDHPAVIIYTGGTTGVPKGAVLSNDCFVALSIEILGSGIEYEPGETFLNIMPPFIAYGICGGLNMHLSIGLTNILIPAFKPEDFCDYILKYRPNHLMGVPAFFEKMADDPRFEGADLSFIHDAATGGDFMSEGTEKKINEFFRAHNNPHYVLRGYGMTELGSVASMSSDAAVGPGSVGIPMSKTVFTVRDPDTREELPPNTQGELYCATPAMMLGYYNNPEEEKKVFWTDDKGTRWVRTGDIGYMDEEGFVYLVGRLKRMIVRPDGHNTWPSQMEDMASKFEGVKEVVVVGLKNPDGEHGRLPTAFIIPTEERLRTEEFLVSLRTYMEKNLPGRDVPFAYRFIDKMPLTSIGKVDYRLLEEIPYEGNTACFIDHIMKNLDQI